MGRLGKLKRQAIQEANKKNLGIIEENHAGFSLGFANNGGLSIQEEEITETTEAEEVEEEGDGEEVNDYGTDPTNKDTDRDGLEDGDEVNDYGSDPTKKDTDDDGSPSKLAMALKKWGFSRKGEAKAFCSKNKES